MEVGRVLPTSGDKHLRHLLPIRVRVLCSCIRIQQHGPHHFASTVKLNCVDEGFDPAWHERQCDRMPIDHYLLRSRHERLPRPGHPLARCVKHDHLGHRLSASGFGPQHDYLRLDHGVLRDRNQLERRRSHPLARCVKRDHMGRGLSTCWN